MNQDSDRRKTGDANRDPISGAPGAHPVGTGVGAAAGGAAAGAAVGSVAGPVGTAAGIVAGAVAGGYAGKGVAEAVNPTVEDAYWESNHIRQPYSKGRPYSDYQGAYRTGYEGYSKYGSSGRDFEQCEVDLQRDYEKHRGTSKLAWSEAKDAARAAWQKIGGRHERLLGYDVQDQSNNKVGTVHNLWVDQSGQPTFLGVKTGWLGLGKNHVVPVHTAQVNDRQRVIRLPFLESKIKEAPSFDADADLSDADESSIYRYYAVQRPQFGTAQPQTQQTAATGTNKEAATVRLSEEQLKVGKREVEAGGIRLRKIVRTEIVQQPVELKREEIVVERVPAGGATAGTHFEAEDVFIPLRREELVIEKQPRVTEEVRVSKKTEKEQRTVSEQVRKEDVQIEEEGKPRFGTEPGAQRQQTPRYEPKERGKR